MVIMKKNFMQVIRSISDCMLFLKPYLLVIGNVYLISRVIKRLGTTWKASTKVISNFLWNIDLQVLKMVLLSVKILWILIQKKCLLG